MSSVTSLRSLGSVPQHIAVGTAETNRQLTDSTCLMYSSDMAAFNCLVRERWSAAAACYPADGHRVRGALDRNPVTENRPPARPRAYQSHPDQRPRCAQSGRCPPETESPRYCPATVNAWRRRQTPG